MAISRAFFWMPEDRLAFLLAFLNLPQQHVGRLGTLVQIVVELGFQKIDDEVASPSGPSGPISFDPSFVLVCDSNIGSSTLTLIAAMTDVRMSAASKSLR